MDRLEQWLHALYVVEPGAALRDEDRKKVAEIAALLPEIDRAVAGSSGSRDLTIVDAAAGKAYAGLLAAKLSLEPAGRPARVIVIEREPDRIDASRDAISRLELRSDITIELRCGDVADASMWPDEPSIVIALHACGPASDAVIDATIHARARRLLLVPCCTGSAVAAAGTASRAADELGIPRHGAVQQAFREVVVAAERTLRLEAAGWETEVVPFVPPTVTPYNLLWRARRVGEPNRMREAASRRARLAGEREV